MEEVNNLIYAQVNFLLNSRLRKGTFFGQNLFLKKFSTTYEIHHVLYGDISSKVYESLSLPKSIEPFERLENEFNLPTEIVSNVFEFLKAFTNEMFAFQNDLQYQENNNQRIFFLCQALNFNEAFQMYNVRNFLKYSYTSTDLYKSIGYLDGEITLFFKNENFKLYPLVFSLMCDICSDDILEILNPIIKSILVKESNTSDENLLSDIINDDLAQYILVDHNKLKLDTKKYLKILLKCLDEKQGAVNILVSKFILNSFLHYVLPYDLSFLKNHEEKLIKYSGNKKILKKMYKVLYNLNQVKGNFWDSIDFKRPNKNYTKYEIIYSLEMKKQ